MPNQVGAVYGGMGSKIRSNTVPRISRPMASAGRAYACCLRNAYAAHRPIGSKSPQVAA